MNPISVPPLLMAAICFYAGLYNFVLYIRQSDEKENITFAILCFCVGVYDIFSYGLYNSLSLVEGLQWQRLQLLTSHLIAISFTWFMFFLVKSKTIRIYMIMTIVYASCFILGLLIENDLTLTLAKPSIKAISFFKYQIVYYEAEAGIISSSGMAGQLAGFIYLLYVIIKNYRITRFRYLKPFIGAIIIFFFASINDVMISSGIYSSIYIVEYSFLILILSMTNLLLNKLVSFKESLALQLYTDTLTGLPNRQKLINDIEHLKDPCVMLINIDSFKEINDFYGNETGDFILLEMAERLKKIPLEHDYILYKMHGDEYTIVIDMHSDSQNCKNKNVKDIVQYLFEHINDNRFEYKNIEINVRVTIGVAHCNGIEDINSKEAMKRKILNNADMVLQEAKRIKKSFMVYDDSTGITKEFEKNILWADKLKKALVDGRIVPYYQPIINNLNGKIEKYECLARLIDSDGKVITPNYFLDISQKVRLYGKITKAMMEKAFNTFKNNHYELTLNLSVIDILNTETNKFIMDILSLYPDIARRVSFEIIESEGIQNYDIMNDFIKDIKSRGCRLAIDDFGSGYSNFEHIIKLHVDYIKIDASIIKNLDNDRHSHIIAKMIVNAAKELGLMTIAEFVHSKIIYDICRDLGIDFSQGFYFSEPKSCIEI